MNIIIHTTVEQYVLLLTLTVYFSLYYVVACGEGIFWTFCGTIHRLYFIIFMWNKFDDVFTTIFQFFLFNFNSILYMVIFDNSIIL